MAGLLLSLPSRSPATELSGEKEIFGMSTDSHIAGYPRAFAPHLELKRVLGEGGSSIVFEAFHARLKVPVAVKLLTAQGALAQQARERLLREAELYAQLDDPRIPRVYDVLELPDGTPYVVMEFVPGGSLESLLEEGPLSAQRAIRVTLEVLSALAYVHARGILHRDVKPANVILHERSADKCEVRLVDFGIAKLSLEGLPSAGALTQQGTLVGTPHYMAPERILGQACDFTADLYSVGVMLYEMLVGVAPFTGPTLGEVIASVLRDTPRPLREVRPDLPRALEEFLARAMAREPGDRFASALSMQAALSEIVGLIGSEISSPRIVPAAPSTLRPLPFQSLQVTHQDLLLTDRRPDRQRSWLPWLGAGALLFGLWAVVPRSVGDQRGTTHEASTSVAPSARPDSEPALQGPVPTEGAAKASGALAADAPALGEGDDHAGRAELPLAEGLRATLPLEVEGVGAAEPIDDGALTGEDARRDEDDALEAATTAPARAPDAPDMPAKKVPARVPRPVDDTPHTAYEPVRSVPLAPLIDRLDRMLEDEPAVTGREPSPAAGQNLPSNPYE